MHKGKIKHVELLQHALINNFIYFLNSLLNTQGNPYLENHLKSLLHNSKNLKYFWQLFILSKNNFIP